MTVPTVRVHPLECGWLTATNAAFILEGLSGELRLPIPSYAIEHPSGRLAVFDAGLHPELRTSTARLGSSAALFRVEFGAGESLGERLSAAGFDPTAVEFGVLSHLHFDHVGGVLELPNATLVVQGREWAAGHHPKLVERDVYNPADFDLGHGLVEPDGEHDLFGDGSVVCVPTPGHTAGHQSLRVQTESGEVVLCGDACYLRHALEEDRVPAFGFDLDMQRRSMGLLRQFEAAGATLVFGHDADQWSQRPSHW